MSTIESEYCTLKETGQQAAWIRQVLLQLGYISQDAKSMKLNCNNISALSLAENNQTTDRSKHIDIYYYWTREAVERGILNLHYVPSVDNIADGLTKPLPRIKFNEFVQQLGLETITV
jgi:isoleucyl-tRNA synthetase